MHPALRFARRTTQVLVLLLAGDAVAAAEGDWVLCGAGLRPPIAPALESPIGPPDGSVQVAADEANLEEGDVSTLRGNVSIRRGTSQLTADRVTYDKRTEILNAYERVQLWDTGVYAAGDSAELDLGTEAANLENATFMLLDGHGSGTAKSILIEGGTRLLVTEATYTTCNPGDADWALIAKTIELDRVNHVGEARNVRLELFDVPVLYTPWLSFPLSDERKSGLLPPKIRVSGSSGVEVTVPYYFNLAPNYDATIAARTMSDRGVQAQGEFRYLTGLGAGEVGGEYIPHDRILGDDRVAFNFRHGGELYDGLSADADVSWVSDADYFEDLGTNLGISSQRHLERRGDLTYTQPGWWSRIRVQDYQTLDDTIAAADRPYERLPQFEIATNLRERNRALNFGAHAEAVAFERDDSVTGSRLDLRPHVSFPMRSAGAFLVPKASVRMTQYDLSDNAPGVDDTPSRVIPTLSADGGLFFDRPFEIGERSWTQTLEPRAFWVLTPHDDQSDLPVFDTARYSFNFSQLFREDRFSSADRVGDTHHVSLALTSRVLAPDSGREVLRASLGQIRYLRDRRTTLPGLSREDDDGSDLVAEFGASPDQRWRFLAGIQWDPSAERTDKSTIAVRYQPDSQRVINAAYRFLRETEFTREDSVEQADISFAWPLTHTLRAVGRWNYALARGTTLESFAGLEYESCCWALRTVFRRHLSSDGGDHTNGVFVQFELKGLTGVGASTVDFLERNIPGYNNDF